MSKKRSNFAGKVSNNSHRQNTAGSSYGYLNLPKGVSVFTVDPGNRHKFDILPYEVTDPKHLDRDNEKEIAIPGSLWYKKPFKVHRNIGTAQDSVICLRTFGKPCPICDHWDLRKKEGAEKEELDALKPSLRNLYIIVPRGEKKFEETLHVLDISQAMFQKLLNEEVDENSEYEVFPDPSEDGFTLKVRFDSKTIGKGKAFAEASRIDFEPRSEAIDQELVESVPNLDEMLRVLSFKEVHDKFFELESEEPADDEPISKTKPSKKTEEDDDEPVRKPAKKEPVPVPTWEQLEKKSMTGLATVISLHHLDIDPDDYDDEDLLARAIATELDIEVPRKKSASKPDPEDDEKPVRKPVRKAPETETEDDDEKPVRKPASKPSSTSECPYNHRFGKDCEKFDDCDRCKKWDACKDEQENPSK